MRFDFDAYEKVYPQSEVRHQPIESAVDTFKPTEAESKAMEKPGADTLKVETPEPDPEPEKEIPDVLGALAPEGETNE